jgi:lactate racemase
MAPVAVDVHVQAWRAAVVNDAPWVLCGHARLPVPRADAFEPPPHLVPAGDLDDVLQRALERPVGAPRLRELARRAASVVVTIPDASRPCPSAALLRHLIAELQAAGVNSTKIGVAVGCGLHATTSSQEKARLAGHYATERVHVFDAQGIESEVADLGTTARGAPVHIVRRVAKADVVITVGVVEPHLYAGFSGGVKGVAIGCAGRETIAWTHRPAFISEPGVTVGQLDGNPFQETLSAIAARTNLRWAVNVVMNERSQACHVLAGDPLRVQSLLVQAHGGVWLRPVAGTFDVLVAGVHAPKSANFYQASRAATYAGLAPRPALTPGGLIVLCADLPHGAGDGPGERNFAEVLAGAPSAKSILARGLREPLGPGGQRSYVVARVLERFRLAVVGASDTSFLRRLEHLGVSVHRSVDEAVFHAETRLGRRASVLAVADAMSTVVHLAGKLDRPAAADASSTAT